MNYVDVYNSMMKRAAEAKSLLYPGRVDPNKQMMEDYPNWLKAVADGTASRWPFGLLGVIGHRDRLNPTERRVFDKELSEYLGPLEERAVPAETAREPYFQMNGVKPSRLK